MGNCCSKSGYDHTAGVTYSANTPHRMLTKHIVVNCTDTTFKINKSLCPMTIESAVIVNSQCITTVVEALTVAETDGGKTLTFTPVNSLPIGQYRLVISTDCGCFNTPITVIKCTRPTVQGQHIPTPWNTNEVIQTCEAAST